MMAFQSKYSIQDRVIIDADRHLAGYITAVQFRQTRGPLYGVSYVHNGDAKEAWIEEWRLSWWDADRIG